MTEELSLLLREALSSRHGREVVEESSDIWRVEPA
jgi:hypothetical protein